MAQNGLDEMLMNLNKLARESPPVLDFVHNLNLPEYGPSSGSTLLERCSKHCHNSSQLSGRVVPHLQERFRRQLHRAPTATSWAETLFARTHMAQTSGLKSVEILPNQNFQRELESVLLAFGWTRDLLTQLKTARGLNLLRAVPLSNARELCFLQKWRGLSAPLSASSTE
jgi:hypothetical protein